MCDDTKVHGLLGGAGAALAAAIAAIGVAIGLNSSFFAAWKAPLWMGIAAGATGLAILLLGLARGAAEDYLRCMRGTSTKTPCQGKWENLRNAIDALLVVLGMQVTAAGAAALQAWIPIAGQWVMWTILGTLVLQVGLIPSLYAFWAALHACLSSQTGTRRTPLVNGALRYQVATCALSRAECDPAAMKPAGGTGPTFSTAKTFAVLVTPQSGAAAITSLAATITDSFGSIATLGAQDLHQPGGHRIVDPQWWAAHARWATLSSTLRADPSIPGRTWRVEVTATLADGSREVVKLKVLVSN